MSEQKPKLTEGQKRVRLGFNPSGLNRVHKYKTMVASAIDYLCAIEKKVLANKEGASPEDIGEILRETATAKTSLQQASSMGVGAMTTDLAFKVLGSNKVDEELEVKSGSYTKKPVTVGVTTFEDFVEYGKKNAGNLNDEGYPLSFNFQGHPITHESNTVYIVPTNSGHANFTPNDVLITQIDGEIYPCKIELFKATYTD